MLKTISSLVLVVALVGAGIWWWQTQQSSNQPPLEAAREALTEAIPQVPVDAQVTNPLQIMVMRAQSYPGSDIQVVETLNPGSNYQRYRVSYESDGNTIYALMTVPNGTKPANGWPVIVFNHGYIPPDQYRTTQRYVGYVDGFAREGYIVFRSDYRGHDESEGEPEGAYGSPGYTRDVLNAVSSLKRHADVDDENIGMWGHSMGGFITLRSMVVVPDIKAGVIWGGVVAPYSDMLSNWRRSANSYRPPPGAATNSARSWRTAWQQTYGSPEENPDFWNSVSANYFVADISGPVQIHHARGDQSVPWEFSQTLADELQAANQEVELFLYDGDDHDISGNFSTAMRRSVAFFDRYLKP